MFELDLGQQAIRLLRFNRRNRILLYRRLSSFIKAGVPVKEALEKIHERYATRQDGRERMLRHWLHRIKSGHTVADALRAWLPPGECILLEAAQESGDLARGFARTAWLSETSGQLGSRFLSAISYPVVILLLLLSVTIWFAISLVPTFAEAIPPEQWQGSARQLYHVSGFLIRYGPYLLLLIIVACLAFAWSIPRWSGTLRARLDNYPPYSFYRMYQSTVFLISLAAMARANIPIYEALTNIQSHSSRWLRDKVNRMRLLLQTGAHPGEALHSSLFDGETLDDLYVYGLLGDLGSMLDAVGEHIIQTSLQRVEATSKVLNYLLLAGAGLQITWMISALYSLPDGLTQPPV